MKKSRTAADRSHDTPKHRRAGTDGGADASRHLYPSLTGPLAPYRDALMATIVGDLAEAVRGPMLWRRVPDCGDRQSFIWRGGINTQLVASDVKFLGHTR